MWKTAIYVGKGHTRKLNNYIFRKGIGYVDESVLSFGQLGKALWWGSRWDFRPDDLNVRHSLKSEDLVFQKL